MSHQCRGYVAMRVKEQALFSGDRTDIVMDVNFCAVRELVDKPTSFLNYKLCFCVYCLHNDYYL